MSLTGSIKNRFGSKKGLLRYIAYEVLKSMGLYRRYIEIDFAQVKRLVFICHGNICRSPLGEAIACQHGIPALSFGLDTRGNDNADPRAIAWAKENGYSLESHITKRIDQYQPQAGDLLIGMEPKHVHKLSRLFALEPVQITLIGVWLNPGLAYLHDPYNANQEYFTRCEGFVREGAVAIVKFCNLRPVDD